MVDNPSGQRYGVQLAQMLISPHKRDRHKAIQLLQAKETMVDNVWRHKSAHRQGGRGQEEAVFETVCGLVFNQMTADAGIKKHGQLAIDALVREFAQLNRLEVFEGIDQHGPGLGTDRRHAGNIINAVTHQALVIRELLGAER